ncbi:MAG: CoxG family protein, partial [Solimonas sp.]
MELTGEQLLPVARGRVWAALLDSETMRMAIPGCEAVTHEGEGRYLVSVLAAVGPVRARFKGRLQQLDLDPPQRYTLSFEGDGGVAGFARGSAEVELSEADGSSTRLTYR